MRWSHPDQWHLTLAFMGSAPERVVEDVVDGSRRRGRRAPLGSELSVTGGGCFPDVTRAKVLWAGVDGSDGVAGTRPCRGWRAGCGRPARWRGQHPRVAPFVPHLTLGRFSRAQDATRWVRVLEAYAGPPWMASEVAVVASHLPRERGTAHGTRCSRGSPSASEAAPYTGGGIRPGCRGPRSSADRARAF